jgi:hypothetical protein
MEISHFAILKTPSANAESTNIILFNSKKFSDYCPFNGSLSRTTTPFSLGKKIGRGPIEGGECTRGKKI